MISACQSSQPCGTEQVGVVAQPSYRFRHLPTSDVRYPESWSQRAIVESWSVRNAGNPPSGLSFVSTPVRWAYCPRNRLALDGQHSEVVTNDRVNVTPCAMRSSRTCGMGQVEPVGGVRFSGTEAMHANSESNRW